jgi:hypothetical protein
MVNDVLQNRSIHTFKNLDKILLLNRTMFGNVEVSIMI